MSNFFRTQQSPIQQQPQVQPQQSLPVVRVRVSSVSGIEYNPCCAYLNIVKGISGPVQIEAIAGTGHHFIREWWLSHYAEIQEQIRATQSRFEVYDQIKGFWVKAVQYGLNKTIERCNQDGFNLSEQDYLFLENSLLEGSLREATIEAFGADSRRQFLIDYSVPNGMILEGPFSCQVPFPNRILEVTAHPDLFFIAGSDYVVYDYKSGVPPNLNVWVHPYHKLQLDGYSFVLNANGIKVPLGVVFYTQDFTMFRVRPVKLELNRFYSALCLVNEWFDGKVPEFERKYVCGRCAEFVKEECKKVFRW